MVPQPVLEPWFEPRRRYSTRGAVGATRVTGNMHPPQVTLTGIHDQIGHIYSELAIQLKRMAQIQKDLDDVRKKLQMMTDEH